MAPFGTYLWNDPRIVIEHYYYILINSISSIIFFT